MMEAGKHVPALANMPTLLPGTQQYIEAFNILHSSRAITDGGALSIPITEIAAYLQVIEVLDIDTRLDYITFIQACDNEYLSVLREKQAADGNLKRRSGPKGRSSGRGGRGIRP